MTIEEWLQYVMGALIVAYEGGQDIWDRVMVGGCCNGSRAH
jgi:hypothetical protein